MMEMKFLVPFLLVALVHVSSGMRHGAGKKVAHSAWDYASRGPKTWGAHCGGQNQSPINIVTCETSKARFFNRVFSHNYWKPTSGKYTIVNNGHALQINLPSDTPYELKKGNKNYTPLQIHIHFDPTTGEGSEHTLNSRKYFAEIHIVHRNSKYTTKEQYMAHSDGLLVIGIFVDLVKGLRHGSSNLDFTMRDLVSQVMKPNDRTSFAMQVFGYGAKYLRSPGESRTITAFPLAWIFPKVERKKANFAYVNYKGSLTTPPCSEIVDWIVITGKTLEVNERTARAFRGVKNAQGTLMAGNNRPIRPLHGRHVFGVKGAI